MRRIGMAVVLLLFAACGSVQSTPSANTSPTPSAKPSQPATLLLAVLEANGTANPSTYNTVAIAGLDGYARAKTTFTPISVPTLGCMGAVVPPAAHVAGGKVYYADGLGVVRSLGIDGKIATVATFPLTSAQQMLSFAVSPDGRQILGTVFTAPKNALSCDGTTAGTAFTFDAYTAASGQASQLVYHQSWSKPPEVMALTGWDALGPIGTYPTVWASQGGGPGSTLGVFVRIDATTLKPRAPFSDPSSCQVWDSVSSGAFVCTKDARMTGGGTAQQKADTPVSVRRADGTELWQFTLTSTNAASSPLLAPDGHRVVICCADVAGPGFADTVIGQDGSRAALPNGFGASGWLDSATMIGVANTDPLKQPPFLMAYVQAADPTRFVSMGFPGVFVGVVGTQ